jgi:hypothetical protein
MSSKTVRRGRRCVSLTQFAADVARATKQVLAKGAAANYVEKGNRSPQADYSGVIATSGGPF